MLGDEPFDWELFGLRALMFALKVTIVAMLVLLCHIVIRSAVLDALTEWTVRGLDVPLGR